SESDVIVTCTTAHQPFLGIADVRPGTFVAAIGADNPEKSEIEPALMAKSRAVTDVRALCAVMGDLHHAVRAGAMTEADVHADLALKGHPESFQISEATGQIFINLPSVHAIGVVDRRAAREKAAWPTRSLSGNYPMALDDAAKHVIVAFRDPPRLAVYAMADGASVAERETCGDSDDIFFDTKRKRVYVICGAGFIDVFDAAASYQPIARIPTVSGARTALFIPSLDLLALGRASGNEPAAIWLYRAAP